MTRIEEIAARLAEIATEIDSAEGDTLSALEREVQELTEERTRLENEESTRQALRNQVATGAIATRTVVPAAASTGNNTPEPSAEEVEVRSFAAYIRGSIDQLRANEQNFNLTNNGAVLPTSIANRIIEKVKDICPIFAKAEIYHVKGTLKLPVYGPKNVSDTDHDITVGYSSDFSELTADAGAFSSVDLTGYLVGALTLIGKSLINSADIDLVNFVVNKMGEDIAIFVEKELLVGTENKCTGALSTSNTMNAGSTSAISADNLIDLQSKIKQAYQADACWTMHPNTFALIKKLKDGNGKYIIQDDFTGEFPFRLLGKPVYLSDNMPTIASAAKAVLYGDYSGLAVNVRENMSVEVLREKYATQHAIGIVGYIELDSKVANAQKLATLTMSAG